MSSDVPLGDASAFESVAPPRATVLVVDDDPRNRTLVRGRLAPTYEILEAENGTGAIDLVERSTVDLVLLDVMMPDMNGFDACRAIKRRAGAEFLPVILLTALNSQEDKNEGLAAGADEFLSKPIDRQELSLRVHALITLRNQRNQIRRQVEDLQHLQALKDDLFALIVHDLRNPLAGVVGFLEILQLQLSDPALVKARHNADQAAEASRKLRDLLDEVLEVRRLEEEGIPLRRESVALASIAREAVATLLGAAKSRGIRLEVAVEGDPTGTLDRSLVRRAVENLVANAIKFSPADDAVLVSARSVGDNVLVEVADRGPGISDSTKVMLFKKFASIEARRSGERRRGFGLGLHLVKLVADAHGGSAYVLDREGGGSTFGLSLPTMAP